MPYCAYSTPAAVLARLLAEISGWIPRRKSDDATTATVTGRMALSSCVHGRVVLAQRRFYRTDDLLRTLKIDDLYRSFNLLMVSSSLRRLLEGFWKPCGEERSPWEQIFDLPEHPGVASTAPAPLLHTQQMAVEMPPTRVPIMAAIGPVCGGRVELLSSNLGPAAAATTMRGCSEAFQSWLMDLERRHEERLLQEAQRRFCHCGPYASLNEFKKWLCAASHLADEATVREMRRAQLCAWLLCVRRLAFYKLGPVSVVLPFEVKDCIDHFLGGRHVWGPITAARAKVISECAQRQLKRSEGLLRQSALAALVACYTEIPTDDVALQALFEVVSSEPQQTKEVGAMLCSHLAIDGFQATES